MRKIHLGWILLLALVGCSATPGTMEEVESQLSQERQMKRDKAPVTPASHQDSTDYGSEERASKEQQNEPDQNTSKPVPVLVFDHEDFSLMGVTIGQSQISVVHLLGKPNHSYSTDGGPIAQIHEYDGFTLGYSGEGIVKWISVTGAHLQPFKDGLFIGTTKQHVLELLGKPTYQNEYQMRYEHSVDQLVFKLDIDPDSGSVQSMSLYINE